MPAQPGSGDKTYHVVCDACGQEGDLTSLPPSGRIRCNECGEIIEAIVQDSDLEWKTPGFGRGTYAALLFGVHFPMSVLLGFYQGEQIGISEAIASLVSIAFGLFLVVMRVRSIGYSWWMALAMFVPIYNLWWSLLCLAAQPGYAATGQFDRAGKRIIIVTITIIVLLITAVLLLLSLY